MATFYSQAAFPGIGQDPDGAGAGTAPRIVNVFRSIREGRDTLAATVKIPAGSVLAAADTLEFYTLGAGVEPLSFSVRTDALDDDAGVVWHLGTHLDADAFITTAGGIAGRSGAGGRKRVENGITGGGTDPFAVQPFVPFAVPNRILMTIATAPTTQTVASTLDRYVTVECDFQLKNFRTPDTSLSYNYGN